MFIKTLKESLPYLIESKIAVMLWSPHGVGKSQSIKQFCEENKYKFIDIRLGNMEVGDLLGLADFDTDKNGRKIATRFITPDWVKEVIDYALENPESKAVVFLDELNRSRRDLLQSVFQLVLDHKHHVTVFPENVCFISACNPPTDEYVVTDLGDAALLSRFCHIKLSPSNSEWFDHADRNDFDLEVVNFLKDQTPLLKPTQQDFTLDFVKPNPRAWEFVSRLRKAKTPVPLLQEICYGLVGHAATAAFIESLKSSDKPFTAEDILDNFDKIEKKVTKYSSPEVGRFDLLKYTGDNLVKFIQERKEKLSKAQEKNLTNFIKTIPADLSFNLCRSLYVEKIVQECIDKDEDIRKMFKKARKNVPI